MRSSRLILPATVALAISGCGAPPPRNEQATISGGQPPADIAPPLQDTVRVAERADLRPPGAVIGSDSPSGDAEAIAFDSRNPPSRLLAWYRSPDRGFRIGSELQEGAEYVLAGSSREPDRDFTVRLAPGRTGGTSGMILFTDR